MATGTLSTFESAVHDAHAWLRDIMRELDWDDRARALQALRGVLQTLRDRLLIDQSAHLSAQLPLLVRGIYFENWDPSRAPLTDRHLDEFVDRIRPFFAGYAEPIDPIAVTRAVFTVLGRHISAGEREKVRQALPEPLRALWTP